MQRFMPEIIRTERTDLGRVLELLMGLALGDQPANLVIDRLPLRLNARNLLPVGDGNLVDKGGNIRTSPFSVEIVFENSYFCENFNSIRP